MKSFFREIYLRRDLVRELVVRDLKVRYARSALGILWVFFSPLLTVAVFYLIFFLFLKVNTAEAPFILYLMTAVFTWRFFQDSLMCSVTSLVDNRNLVRESNFPHYLIPLSIVFSNAIIFMSSLVILLISVFVLKEFSVWVLFLPLVLSVHFIIVLGLSIISSVIYVRCRDLKYVLEALLLLLFYLTPAFYSISLVKNSFPRLLFEIYLYNPFTVILNLYRFTLLKGCYVVIHEDISLIASVLSIFVFALFVLCLALWYYKKYRLKINDYLSY
ncbi:MAG: ABC transporter permease [Candidatus Omnitrophica bacterium]|nr:ABC transporter permease [Candidatus Omnitrophota bacterium]